MVLSTSIPTEIIEVIIDHLHDDHEALQAASFVSTSFLPRSQMHLFSEMWISLAPDQHTMERLRQLYVIFLMSPHLALYVKNAYLTGYINEGWENHKDEPLFAEEIIPHMLQLLQRVRQVDLVYLSRSGARRGFSQKGRWTDHPQALRTAILDFCKNPSVTDITISQIRDFPIPFLAMCPGLKNLSLRDMEFSAYNAQNIELDLGGMEASRAQIHLDTLEMGQSFSTFFPLVAQVLRHPNSIVSLSQLRALKLVGSLPIAIHPVWEDINHCAPSLECLMWNQATDWGGRTVISKFYAEPLNLAQMKNLRFLVLEFLADFNKYGIIPNLGWLTESLDRLRQGNQIEDITIILIYESWNRDNTNALLTVWTKRLDTVIYGTGFPALRRVRIILPDFADRVRRFTIEVKPQLGLQAGEYFKIEPLRTDATAVWKQAVARVRGR